IIDEILLAEEQSEQIVASSKKDAIKMLSKAEEESFKIKAKAEEDYKNNLNTLVDDIENNCKQKYQENMSCYYKDCEDLERSSKDKIEEAVKLIVDNIGK
ncbi:MAG: hypothetical protein IJD48_02790, partial [Clostridia bacterium]|nr:hypothetical protein [Clostridia bacterium]